MLLAIQVLLSVCFGATTVANISLMCLDMQVQQYRFNCFHLVSTIFIDFYSTFADVLVQADKQLGEESLQNILQGT